MKNSKRILSVFLALALVISCLASVSVFADEAEEAEETTEVVTVSESDTAFTDVKSTEKYATAVTVLNKLSIINGYEESDGTFTFKPANNVTRAEFAALLLRMLGMDQTATPTVAPFPDVPTTLWAAGTITMAKNMNIITGYEDGTFRPDNNVSYEEALTMIIRAIGYENYSAPGSVWYSRYVSSAQRLGITKNAVGSVGTPATRACIAQFIYDTLEVNARENDEIQEETIMETYLGLLKEEGVIASNGVTSLSSPDVTLRDNEILIADKKTGATETFRVDNVNEYKNQLGATVSYYYKEDKATGYKDIIMFSVKAATKSETIKADQLAKNTCDNLTIAYYKNDTTTNTSKFSLAADNVVIYNDKLYGSTASASKFQTSMLPTIGEITVLDTDGDNDYDVVFIESYELFAVSTVSASTYTVTDKITSTAGKSIVLDYKDDDQIINFVDTKGKELTFSSIKKNGSICVKESNDNNGTKMYTVIVISSGVSGEVKSISSDKLTVGSKSYNYSPAAPWKDGAGDLTTPVKGSTYTFFLDMNNEIFAYTKDTTSQASSNYGFIVTYAREGSNLEKGELNLLILTQSGEKIKYPLYKSTKINGTSIAGDYDEAIDLLEDSAQYQALSNSDTSGRQLIKYTTKSVSGTTVIDTIVTVTASTSNDTKGGDAEAETLRMYGDITSEDSAKYTSSTKLFTSGSNKVYLASATVFVIPDDMTSSSDYRKGSSSDFKNGKSYNIEVFDMTTSKNAKVVVLYGGDSTTEVDSKTALFRFEEAEYTSENTPTGEEMLQVSGYENGATTLSKYWVSSSSEGKVEALSEGDMVRFGTDADGYVTLSDDDIMYQDGMSAYLFAWDEDYDKNSDSAKKMTSPDFKVVLGTLYSTADDTVIISPEFDTVNADITDLTEVVRLDASKFSGAKFYKYDTSERELEITAMTESYQDILESLTTYEDSEDSAAKVFVHIRSGAVKTVLIIVE